MCSSVINASPKIFVSDQWDVGTTRITDVEMHTSKLNEENSHVWRIWLVLRMQQICLRMNLCVQNARPWYILNWSYYHPKYFANLTGVPCSCLSSVWSDQFVLRETMASSLRNFVEVGKKIVCIGRNYKWVCFPPYHLAILVILIKEQSVEHKHTGFLQGPCCRDESSVAYEACRVHEAHVELCARGPAHTGEICIGVKADFHWMQRSWTKFICNTTSAQTQHTVF
jgi:hypothetical protein